MNQIVNELGKSPMRLANLGTLWIGECNLDLKSKCFIPSPSKCRPWGQLEPGAGWEDGCLEQTQHSGRCLEDHRLASSTQLLADQRVEREGYEVDSLPLCFLIQKQSEPETLECPLLSWGVLQSKRSLCRRVTFNMWAFSLKRAPVPPLWEAGVGLGEKLEAYFQRPQSQQEENKVPSLQTWRQEIKLLPLRLCSRIW